MSIRLLGLLPLYFFLHTAVFYWGTPEAPHILWVCNISNILMGLGMLLGKQTWTLVGLVWIIAGIPLWLIDGFVVTGFEYHSFLTHISSPIIGFYFCRKQGPPSGIIWIYAFIYFVALQILTHYNTPPELNINVSHDSYGPFAGYFPNYTVYYLANAPLLMGYLFLLDRKLKEALVRNI